MKNKIGKIGGFALGVIFGFLAIVVLSYLHLSYLHPEEGLAGITIIMLLISGLFFSFVGSLFETYFLKKRLKE